MYFCEHSHPFHILNAAQYVVLAIDNQKTKKKLAHHVAVLTLRAAIPVIELHALQGAMTAHATETVGVEEFVHGSDGRLRAGQSLAALPTHL